MTAVDACFEAVQTDECNRINRENLKDIRRLIDCIYELPVTWCMENQHIIKIHTIGGIIVRIIYYTLFIN